MRFSIVAVSAVLIFTGMMFSIGSAGEKTVLKPGQHWGGIVNDMEKQSAAPKAGFLTTQEAFEKLWNTWGLKEKAPMVDFNKQIVFVQLASGPNSLGTTYSLDKDGNLTAVSAQTLKAGPGFGFGIDVLERAGIKSYQGKPLE
jgi:hypothetical protein